MASKCSDRDIDLTDILAYLTAAKSRRCEKDTGGTPMNSSFLEGKDQILHFLYSLVVTQYTY